MKNLPNTYTQPNTTLKDRTMNEIITAKPTAQKPMMGRRFIPADMCSYPPAVLADDVLLVDLDEDRVTVDGLYLVERITGDSVSWMGCRRFEVSVLGGVNMIETNGEPVPFNGGLRIAGRVLHVYTRKA